LWRRSLDDSLRDDSLGLGFLIRLAISVVGVPVRTFFRCANRTFRDKAAAQFECDVLVDRAGVRLFLLHAQDRQHVEDDARFYFKLPRQLIDPDFLHRRDC
jgi:hypothetical protein